MVSADERDATPRWLSGVRHPARRDGLLALVLFVLPALVALALEHRDRHVDGGTIGVLVSASLGLPVLWLTWAVYRESRRPEAGVAVRDLAGLADRLALVVGAQWEAEAAVRRLNDPFPLPVSWRPADASLGDAWDVLVTLATTGAGHTDAVPDVRWAAGPQELAGEGSGLAAALGKVPTRRLVVLGEPGSGKSMLLVRLLLDLLAERGQGGPVPVIFPLASWDPASRGLLEWMASRLAVDYPGLAVGSMRGSDSRITALLSGRPRLILPLLDGLDEMPPAARAAALAAISESLPPGEPVIVTCRTRDYHEVAEPATGFPGGVRAAAVVELDPLSAEAVERYLLDLVGWTDGDDLYLLRHAASVGLVADDGEARCAATIRQGFEAGALGRLAVSHG